VSMQSRRRSFGIGSESIEKRERYWRGSIKCLVLKEDTCYIYLITIHNNPNPMLIGKHAFTVYGIYLCSYVTLWLLRSNTTSYSKQLLSF
jgi:hypothetical protein